MSASLTDDEKAALERIPLEVLVGVIRKRGSDLIVAWQERNEVLREWHDQVERCEHLEAEIKHLKARLQNEL